MSFAKPALLAALAAVTLSACASTAKPIAGTVSPNGKPIGRGRIDDPRTDKPNHLACLLQHHLQVTEVGRATLQIGTAPSGPRVVFTPTSGVAQGDVMLGYRWAQGAEVIGAALLFPNQGTASELKSVEDCVANGVSG